MLRGESLIVLRGAKCQRNSVGSNVAPKTNSPLAVIYAFFGHVCGPFGIRRKRTWRPIPPTVSESPGDPGV